MLGGTLSEVVHEIKSVPEAVGDLKNDAAGKVNAAKQMVGNVTTAIVDAQTHFKPEVRKFVSGDLAELAHLSEKELTDLQKGLATDELRKVQTELTAMSARLEEIAKSDITQEARNELEKSRRELVENAGDVAKAIASATLLNDALTKIKPLASEIAKYISLKQKLALLAGKGDRLYAELDKLVPKAYKVAFELPTPLDLTYNGISQTHFSQIRLPQGISYDSEKLKKALEGSPSLPQVNWAKCVGETAGGIGFKVQSGRADAFRRFERRNAGNVYFASERWTEWASQDTAISSGLKIALSGGERSREVGEDIWNHVNAELADILAWGKMQVIGDFPGLAKQAVEDIKDFANLHERGVASTKLNVGFFPVAVGYSTIPQGTTPWSKLIVENIIKNAEQEAGGRRLKYDVKHLGFALVYHPQGATVKDPVTLARRFLELKKKHFWSKSSKDGIEEELFRAFDGVLKPEQVAKLRASYSSISSGRLTAKLQQVLMLDDEEIIRRAATGNYVIDFTDSRASRELEKLARHFALGNDGSAKTERLTLDLRTGRIEANVTVLHRYEWKGVQQAIRDVKETLAKSQSAESLLKPDAGRLMLEQFLALLSPDARMLIGSLGDISQTTEELANLEKKLGPLRRDLKKLPGL